MLNGIPKSFGTVRKRLLVLPAAACGLALCMPLLAGASDSIDQSLLKIEQVSNRLEAAPSMIANVAKAAADDGNTSVAKVEPILELAVRASFKVDSMGDEISDAVAEADDANVDPAAFAKAAAALTEGRAKIETIYAGGDKSAGKDIEARLADPKEGPRIAELADLMAAPDLAAETAFTGQLMYVALEAMVNAKPDQLAAAPQDKLQAQMNGVVDKLRARSENEKPVPKDMARTEEKARLALALATLSPEDLTVLSDFYNSPGGKAKQQALVESYRQASDQSNKKMLEVYFAELSSYLKKQPRPQQQ